MQATTERYKEVFTNIKYLTAIASILGILGGILIVFRGGDAETVVGIALNLFLVTSAAFSLALFILMRRKRHYWLSLLSGNPSECIGLLIGMAIFGSLIAIMFYMAAVFAVPYLLRNPIAPEVIDDLGEVFNPATLLGMSFAITIASGLSLLILKSESRSTSAE